MASDQSTTQEKQIHWGIQYPVVPNPNFCWSDMVQGGLLMTWRSRWTHDFLRTLSTLPPSWHFRSHQRGNSDFMSLTYTGHYKKPFSEARISIFHVDN